MEEQSGKGKESRLIGTLIAGGNVRRHETPVEKMEIPFKQVETSAFRVDFSQMQTKRCRRAYSP